MMQKEPITNKIIHGQFNNSNLWTNFRFYLIKKLAGSNPIILNTKFNIVRLMPGSGLTLDIDGCFISNNSFPVTNGMGLQITNYKGDKVKPLLKFTSERTLFEPKSITQTVLLALAAIAVLAAYLLISFWS